MDDEVWYNIEMNVLLSQYAHVVVVQEQFGETKKGGGACVKAQPDTAELEVAETRNKPTMTPLLDEGVSSSYDRTSLSP